MTMTCDDRTEDAPVREDQADRRVDEPVDDVAAAYARIDELRGRGISVSGAY